MVRFLLTGSTADFPYLISPLEAIQRRAIKDRTGVSWFLDDFDLDTAGMVVQYKDVALVFVNSDSGEGSCILNFMWRHFRSFGGLNLLYLVCFRLHHC